MLNFIQQGGWVMLPIVLCSILALAIVCERAWNLRRQRVLPKALMQSLQVNINNGAGSLSTNPELQGRSSLARVLNTALDYAQAPADVMKERIEASGRHEVLQWERYLSGLGTIAAITPLLGLLGTVIGMIKVFMVISEQGVGDAMALSGGIAEALLTTAAGLVVAIPSLMAYRYFQRRIDEMGAVLEQIASRFMLSYRQHISATGVA